MTDPRAQAMIEAGARAIHAELNHTPWEDRRASVKGQYYTLARACLSAVAAAGYVLVPAEMTEAQARASLAGHALADRVRDTKPDEFARWVKMRQATWRQLVKAMGEVE